MTGVEIVIFVKHSFAHAQHLSHAVIILFIGLDFDSSHSQAVFISICLDTIYYQLFFLVLSLSVSLSFRLLAAGFPDSRGMCVAALACESVCHPPPPPRVISLPVLKEEVCLVCRFIYQFCARGRQCRCDGLYVRLGYDHDLLLKPCGRGSVSQTAPTLIDQTLLPVCTTASSGCTITCKFAKMTQKADSAPLVCLQAKMIHSCSKFKSSLS